MATNAFDIFTGDGSQDQFVFTFDLHGSFSAVVVLVRPRTDQTFTQYTDGVEYNLDRATSTITFATAFVPGYDSLLGGDIIRIERYTDRERQIDYIPGSTLSERDLDNEANRFLSIDQEIEAALNNCLQKNDAGDAWDGLGLPSENCGPAETLQGWVTWAQVLDIFSEGNILDISDANIQTWDGDGIETEFQIADFTGLRKELVWIYVEAIYQSATGSMYEVYGPDDSNYPSSGDNVNDMLVFTDPPADGTVIEMKVITGSIYASIAAGQITSAEIADNAVGLAKINVGASPDADRVLVFDTSGDPTARQLALDDVYDAGTLKNDVLNSLLGQLDVGMFTKETSADLNMVNHLVTGLAAPVGGLDATHKGYVDGRITDVLTLVNLYQFRIAYGSHGPTSTDWFAPGGGNRVNLGEGVLGWRPDIFLCNMLGAGSPQFSFWALRVWPGGDNPDWDEWHNVATMPPNPFWRRSGHSGYETDWDHAYRTHFIAKFPDLSQQHYFVLARNDDNFWFPAGYTWEARWMAIKLP